MRERRIYHIEDEKDAGETILFVDHDEEDNKHSNLPSQRERRRIYLGGMEVKKVDNPSVQVEEAIVEGTMSDRRFMEL